MQNYYSRLTTLIIALLVSVSSAFAQPAQPSMDQFMGTNGFVDTPLDKLEAVGHLREYHPWNFNIPEESEGAPAGGYTADDVLYSYNRWGGFWDFDEFYRQCQFKGIMVCPAIWEKAPFMPTTQNVREKPTDYMNANTLDPSVYSLKARHMWECVARYGAVEYQESDVKLHPGQIFRSGLGYIQYWEDWNEPDRTWDGPAAQFSPAEYAALASACIDGHAGAMGEKMGIKAADPNAKFVMGGTATTDTSWLDGMKTWFAANRSDGDAWPVDVINMHHYCNLAESEGDGMIDGRSPEADNLKARMATLVAWRDTNAPDNEIWLSEWGWDTQAGSVQSCETIGSNDINTVQAQWILREYLILAGTGINRATQFMMRDSDVYSAVTFNTSGLVGQEEDELEPWLGDYRPHISWYATNTMKQALKGLYFDQIVEENDNGVWCYKFTNPAGKQAYAIWMGSSTDASTTYTLSGITGGASDATVISVVPYTQLEGVAVPTAPNQATGDEQIVSISGGSISGLTITEMPIFVQIGDFDTDVTPPSQPTGLAGTADGTKVFLQWNIPSYDEFVVSYDIYIDDVLTFSDYEGFSKEIKGLTPETTLAFKVVAKDEAGNASTASAVANVTTGTSIGTAIDIQRAAGTPTIDGTMEGAFWDAHEEIPILNVLNGTVTDDADASASFKACWDDTNLYLFITLTDDSFKNDGANSWDNDNVEIFFDMLNQGSGASVVGTDLNYETDNMQYRIQAGLPAQSGDPSGLNWTGVNFANPTGATSWTCEVVFPWATLQSLMSPQTINVAQGTAIGFELQISDKDLDGTSGSLVWSNSDNTVPNFRNDENYGDLVLQGGGGPDLTPPSQVLNVQSSNIGDNNVDLSWAAATDNVGVTSYNIYQNGSLSTTTSNLNIAITGLIEGTTYSYEIAAVDAFGNVGQKSAAKIVITTAPTVDTQAPTVPGTPTQGTLSATSVQISWSASSDLGGGTVAEYDVFNNGNYLQTVSAPTTTLTFAATASTTYVLTVSAIDDSDNESAQSSALQVTTPAAADTQAPTIGNLSTSGITEGSINLSWTAASDNVGVTSYELRQNGALIYTGTNLVYTSLGLTASTIYNYTLVAKDAAGNTSSQATASGTTSAPSGDTQAPTTPGAPSYSSVTATTAGLSWGSSVDNTAVAGYNIYNSGTLLTTVANVTSTTLTGLTPSTMYFITVKAVDAAGNESGASAQTNFTTGAAADTQAPTAPSNLNYANVTETSAAISWTASSDNVGVTGYRVYQNGSQIQTPTSTSASISGLSAGTTYIFAVAAIDAAGNISTQGIVQVTTATAADTQAPTAPTSLAVLSQTSTTATLSWTASSDNVGVTSYAVYQHGVVVQSPTTTAVTVTGLVTGTSYAFYVIASDAVGNNSTASNVINISLTDTTNPNPPTNVASSSATETAATLTWTAATDNVAVVSYNVKQSGTIVGTATGTSYSIVGLTGGNTYQYTVTAVDAAGNESVASNIAYVTTISGSDTEAPTAPTNTMSSGVTETTASIAWSSSTDNVGVVSYNIYNSGVLLTTSTSNTSSLTNLTAGTMYILTVKAVDAEGNESNSSQPIIFTTTVTGVSEVLASSVQIVPNPNAGIFEITIAEVEVQVAVTVINSVGEAVLSTMMDGTSTQIDISNLSAGMYIVQLKSKDAVVVVRVMKN